MFSGLQNANWSTSVSCMNIRSIVLFWDPLFQVSLPVGVVKIKPLIFSLLSRCVAYVSTMAYCSP